MPVTGEPGCCSVVPLLIVNAPVELNVESVVAVRLPVIASVLPFHDKLELVASADVELAYSTPFAVNDVRPVPPFVVASVPATVTAPVVAVDGVSPVVPKLIDETFTLPALEAMT